MYNISKKKFFFIAGLLVFVLSLVITIKFRNQSLKEISYNPNLTLNKTRELAPYLNANQIAYLDSKIFYPYVKISPQSFIYPLIIITEKISLLSNKYTNLYFSEKRLAELQKWGEELIILKNTNNVDGLKNWWKKEQPAFLEIYKGRTYSSWESTLARYVLLMEKELQIISDNAENYVFIRSNLTKAERDLEVYIFNLKKPEDEKKYLLLLSRQLFAYLNKEVDNKVFIYNPYYLKYRLKELVSSEGAGVYEVSLDPSTFPSYYKTSPVELKIDDLDKAVANIESDDKPLNFNNITINSDDKYLGIKLKEFYIPIKNPVWQENKNSYYLLVPEIKDKINYLFNFTYELDQETVLRLEKITFNENKQAQAQLLFEEPLYLRKKSLLRKTVNLSKEDSSFFRLVLTSREPISQNNLSQIYIELQPVLDPSIYLEKIALIPNKNPYIKYKKIANNRYDILAVNSIADQDNLLSQSLKYWWKTTLKKTTSNGYHQVVEFWPAVIAFRGLILSSIFLFCMIYYFILKNISKNRLNWIDKLYLKLSSGIYSAYYLIIKRSYSIFVRLKNFIVWHTISKKYIFSAIVILLVLIDFVAFAQTSVFIISLVVIFSFFAFIGFPAEKRISFILSLFFLAIVPLFLIVHGNGLADKSAIWSFVFLSIGAVRMIF